MAIIAAVISLLAILLRRAILLLRFPKREVLTFRTNHRAGPYAAKIPASRSDRPAPDWGDGFHGAFNLSRTRRSIVARVESYYLSYIS
jgi:hypothetical protein